MDFWQSCLKRLESEFSPQLFKTWIAPLRAELLAENTVCIFAPNSFKLQWVKNQYITHLQAAFDEFFKCPITIDFALSSRENAASSDNKKQEPHAEDKESVRNNLNRLDSKPAAVSKNNGVAGLNPKLDFENFVAGKANQLARAAAIQVADNPGKSYNPLFLYGGVGLGKTHLIHAIGNKILQKNPKAHIRYIHAERYVSDVVKAYQRKAFDAFKHYYHSLDLLLIDDIQFFSEKSRTQEEFFYAFEALVGTGSQIIITSDTYPKELIGIEERLKSRFSSGLTVAIEPPELEMRVAILVRKSAQEGIELPENAAFFIAKNVRSNVRELEGALQKVFVYARFHQQAIDVDMIKLALKDLLSVRNAQTSVENIQKTVADFYKIKTSDMYSKRRKSSIALPRQIAMYLTKELTQKSLPEIGELFGGRDHTTVLYATRKINASRQKDQGLNHELHVLEQMLKA